MIELVKPDRTVKVVQLSPHFILSEFTSEPREALTEGEFHALMLLVTRVLEPWRLRIGGVRISDGLWRPGGPTPAGRPARSQHAWDKFEKGAAACDAVPLAMSIPQAMIALQGLRFDQAIEYVDGSANHIHVSYGPRDRRQMLRAWREGGTTKYGPIPW